MANKSNGLTNFAFAKPSASFTEKIRWNYSNCRRSSIPSKVKMEVLIVLIPCAATSALLGGCVGWFTSGRTIPVVVGCVLASLAFVIATSFLLGDPPETFSEQYFLSAAAWYVFPYLFFFFFLSLLGAAAALILKERATRGSN